MKTKAIVGWCLTAVLGIALWYSTCTVLNIIGWASSNRLRQEGGGLSEAGEYFKPIFIDNENTLRIPAVAILLFCFAGAILQVRGVAIPKATVLTVVLIVSLILFELGAAAFLGAFG